MQGYHRSTKITFTCGVGRGAPQFLHETENACQYNFIWATDLVCLNQTHAIEADCYVQDDNGNIFDLSPLISSSKNWEAFDDRKTENYTYYINICRPLSILSTDTIFNGICSTSGASICQTKQGDSNFQSAALGQFSSPQIVGGVIFIEMTELGTECTPGVKRTSRIDFSCPSDPSVGLGNPVYVEEVNCRYYFTWQTILVCVDDGNSANTGTGDMVSCSVLDDLGNTYDLSALSSVAITNINGGGNDQSFSLGICSNAKECNGSVCERAMPNAPWLPIATLASGVLQVVEGTVSITYHNSPCSTNPNVTSTVIILFQCDPIMTPAILAADPLLAVTWIAGKGNDCYHEFEVATSLVCVQQASDCIVNADGKTFDLIPLSKLSTNWRVPDDREDGK